MQLTIENPVKVLFLIFSIISFYFAGSFPDSEEVIKVEVEVKVDAGYVYLYKKAEKSEWKYEIIYSDKKMELDKDGSLHRMEYSGLNVLFYVILVLSLLAVIILSFGDDDVNWEFIDVWDNAFSGIIDCEIENGEYVYISMGRLVGRSQKQIQRSHISRRLNVGNFLDLSTCPRYKTKTQNRDSLLKDLGI